MRWIICLLTIAASGAMAATPADVNRAREACPKIKAEQKQKKANTKQDSHLGRNPAMSADVACNLEFIPCDEDPASARCNAVVSRYTR